MFEIPFNFIFINPVIDVLIFLVLAYYFLFKYYKILLEKNAEKIMWIDLEATAIFLLLGYLNYSGTKISVFGWKVEWWFYIISIQLLVESAFAFYNIKDTREYFRKMRKNSREKEEENLIEVISNMKAVQNFLEQDLNKYKIQGNKKAVEKLESEIEKIEVNLMELNEKLRELRSEKNDKNK